MLQEGDDDVWRVGGGGVHEGRRAMVVAHIGVSARVQQEAQQAASQGFVLAV